jgi:tetratricopeptide (TPR) repeat protein
MKLRIVAAVAAVFLAGTGVASAQEKDTVKKADGEIKGKITRASWQTVVIVEAPGKTHTFKGSDVTDIIFGDEPINYRRAVKKWHEQVPDAAAQFFEDAMKDVEAKKLRPENKAPILLSWGLFLQERGNADAAMEKLKRVRTECGDSWWRPESFRRSIEIAKAKGVEAHKAVLEEMKSEPEPMGSEAEMGLADLSFARGEYDQALSVYTRVSENAASTYAETAKLGAFRTLKTLNRKAELEAFCAKLLADPKAPPSLQQAAGAWSAGSMLEKAGKDKAKVRAALFAAGKAIAMGPPERKEEAEDYVAALRVAAKGYVTLAAGAANADHKQEYLARASGYLREIMGAYKGTPWAEAAQLEFQSLGVAD